MSQNNSIDDDDDQILTSKYQPPKDVPISEILSKDQEDASLNEYKKKLLGTACNIIIGLC
jgi:Rho GDP-dissociation inhibitor